MIPLERAMIIRVINETHKAIDKMEEIERMLERRALSVPQGRENSVIVISNLQFEIQDIHDCRMSVKSKIDELKSKLKTYSHL